MVELLWVLPAFTLGCMIFLDLFENFGGPLRIGGRVCYDIISFYLIPDKIINPLKQ